jgi:antitoxin VapB
MQRQLNIRSDEAYGIAHDIAQEQGKAVTEVVVEALREHSLKKGQAKIAALSEERFRYERILALANEASKHKKSILTSDHSEFYDENGLPI